MDGIIIYADPEPGRIEEVSREQAPIFYSDEHPVFELWLYHYELQRWFCESWAPDARSQQGVVFLPPNESKAQWLYRVQLLEHQAGIDWRTVRRRFRSS